MQRSAVDVAGHLHQHLHQHGYAPVPALISARETRALGRLLRHVLGSAGQREMLAQPWCAALAERVRRRLVERGVLPPDAAAVQCTLFDKTPAHNWPVAWHQDLSLPVAGATDDPGWRGWSTKHGVGHVQPPPHLLQHALAVRLHVDACGSAQGPLRVIPASHRWGRLPLDEARGPSLLDRFQRRWGAVVCTAQAGDGLLMRPLTVHASSRMAAGASGRRRVLHFVFAPAALPPGLWWSAAGSAGDVTTRPV